MNKFSGYEYLQIGIANTYGLDKLSWNERIDWVNTNESKLESLQATAEEPAEYYAAVSDYRKAQKGEPVSHGIALDATCSGAQWLSVLTDDRSSAYMCNVLNSGSRMDLYTDVYKKFAKIVGNNPFITRDKVKRAIMTSLYGSTAQPKDLFGEHVDVFYKVMEDHLSKSWKLNEILRENWIDDKDTISWVMPDNFHVNCTVKQKVESEFLFNGQVRKFVHEEIMPSQFGRSLSPNLIHSVESLVTRDITALAMHKPEKIEKIRRYLDSKTDKVFSLSELNKENYRLVSTLVKLYEKSGYLSARILDYLDETSISLVPEDELRELLSLVPNKPFNTLWVHDCVKVHPNYGNDIRKLYIQHLSKVSRSNMLEFILKQMYSNPTIKVERTEPDMYKEILDSEYALS